MGRFIIIVGLLFFAQFLSANSVERPFFFHYLTLEDDLPHNNVTDIYQDKDGYMWFATYSGLARYDGYTFDHYPLYVPGENYIQTNQLRKIVEDKEGKYWLWAEDRKKVYKMDIYTGKVGVYQVSSNIIGVFFSNSENVLLPTQKELLYYDISEDKFIPLFTLSPDNYLVSFTEDKKGDFYLATSRHQILKYNYHSGKVTDSIYHRNNSLQKELPELIRFLHTDENYLWVLDRKNVLYRYDLKLDSSKKKENIPFIKIDKDVRDILDWTDEKLLLGTFNGIFLLDKEKMVLTEATSHTGNKGELNHFSVNTLFKDRQGILWVGTHSGGVNFHHELHTRFRFLSPNLFSGRISRMQEDKNGNIWFATEGGGLWFYNPLTGEQKNYLLESKVSANHDDNIIKSLFVKGDTIWCGTHRGKVFLFSISKEKFDLYRDYGYNNILSVYEDSNKRLWIATNTDKGLIYIENGKDKLDILSEGTNINLKDISIILESSEGNMLFGSQQNGFHCYNPLEKRLIHISPEKFGLSPLSMIGVTGFYEDKNKDLWVTTDGNGLFCFDYNLNLKNYSLSVDNEMPDKLYHITKDSKGYLWITGSNQIIRFDPLRGEIKEFSVTNGLQMKDFSIYGGGIDKRGNVYFPGSKGCIIADTESFILNEKEPEIHVNTLKLYTDSTALVFSSGKEYPQINLKYNHAPFTVNYTALNYIFPECNRYKYRMQGVDNNWIEANNNREVTYTKLPPGDYVFQVKAANNDGIWNEESANVYISVASPLWLRWWAYVLYFLGLSGILSLYFIHRHHKIQLEHQLKISQLEKEKKEEIHQEKLRVFTHIAHEFKTPLTLILNPLEIIKDKTSHISEIQTFVKMVEKNSDRLLGMVNDLIELQKLESGKLPLNYSNFNFHEFVNTIFTTFQPMAVKRNINFSLYVEQEQINVYLDREEMEKMLNNLLSNAFKFTPPKGKITLSIQIVKNEEENKLLKSEKIIRIEVQDNGLGFSEEKLQHLFEPFSGSVKDIHGEIKGSGIGLSITRSIVIRHGGDIRVRSLERGGTCVQVDLPYFLEGVYFEHNQEINKPSVNSLPVIEYSILLVDDDVDMLNFLDSQLKVEYKIYKAKSANEALEILQKENISLVISDIMMPGIDGLEFCKHLKQSKEFCYLPVILLSAKSLAVHVEEGFEAGADAYMIKPFKVSTLKTRIRNILAIRNQLKNIYNNTNLSESLGIKRDNSEKEFVKKCMEILKKYASFNNFDVEMLVKEVGMSRAAFYRKWKSVTTLSPAEAIRNLRLECAAELLNTSSLTATEIAYEVGFNNYTHFSAAFKARYGVSPKEYKKG